MIANTRGLSTAQVIAALYNASSPGDERSMGWIHYAPGDLPMAEAEALAEEWAKPGYHYDYVKGRSMKIPPDFFKTVPNGTMDAQRYDDSTGRQGRAQEAIDYFYENLQREKVKT